MTLVRRPDTHPLGPGPRLLVCGSGEASASSVWSSDDGGATWTRRTFLTELGDGPGWPSVSGIHAVSEPGESDPGGGGRAVVVLRRGHIYQTADGGETWALVGRVPDMVASGSSTPTTMLGPSEMDPDGRLYVGVAGLGSAQWLYRTVEPFVVSAAAAPPPASALSLTVHPNPAEGTAQVHVAVPAGGVLDVAVYDALGRQVATLAEGTLAGSGTFEVALPALPAGVYLVRAAHRTGDGRTHVAVSRLTVVR